MFQKTISIPAIDFECKDNRGTLLINIMMILIVQGLQLLNFLASVYMQTVSMGIGLSQFGLIYTYSTSYNFVSMLHAIHNQKGEMNFHFIPI
jgi:hypothetical protein